MGQPIASWTWFADLYRFAMILTLDEVKASEATRGALDEALKKKNGHWDEERGHILLFRAVRNRCLKATKPAAAGALIKSDLQQNAAASVASDADIVASLHRIAEPGRSAFALLLLDALDAEAVCKLLGMGIAELSNVVHSTRVELHHCVSSAKAPSNQPGATS